MKPAEVCRRKRPFRLKVHADVFILHLLNHPNRQRRANNRLYTYQCDVCGQWHLTSRETFITKQGIIIHDSP